MADYKALKSRGEQLAARDWNMPALEARIKKLVDEGIPRKTLERDEILANRQIIRTECSGGPRIIKDWAPHTRCSINHLQRRKQPCQVN